MTTENPTTATPETAPTTAPATTPEATTQPILLDAACDVTSFASTDPGRYVITGVHVTADGVEATDGRILIRVPFPAHDPADFPACATQGLPGECARGFVLPAAMLKAGLKAIPKRQTLPILATARLVTEERANGEPPKAFLTATDLERTATAQAECIAGHFPNLARNIPTEAPSFSITLGAALLQRIAEHAQKHASETERKKPGGAAIRFDFNDELSPVRFSYTVGGAPRTATGVLMPMRMT